MPVVMDNLSKAAAMLICLGVDRAAQVLAHLSPQEVQLLADQMAQIGRVAPQVRADLVDDLLERYDHAQLQEAAGGLEFVHRLLSQLFGEERASLVLEQLSQNTSPRPFRRLRGVEAQRLLAILSHEHPAVIALVLYYLPREKAAQVISGLADAAREDVVMRLANLSTPMPQMVARLEQLLLQKLSDTRGAEEGGEQDFASVTGARALVEIMSRSTPAVERRVYEFLQERDPALADEVRKTMFVFEDLLRLDPRDVQVILRALTAHDLALALKNASDALRDLIFTNVSENFAKTIREELELLGPVRVRQIEEAQQLVVESARRLAEEGTIRLCSGDDEDVVL